MFSEALPESSGEFNADSIVALSSICNNADTVVRDLARIISLCTDIRLFALLSPPTDLSDCSTTDSIQKIYGARFILKISAANAQSNTFETNSFD